jgi:ABC-type uncharacterized transport system substrate-binding protein
LKSPFLDFKFKMNPMSAQFLPQVVNSQPGKPKPKTGIELFRTIKHLKRSVIAISGIVIVVSGTVARAEQVKKVPTIGYLAVSTPSAHAPRIDALRQGLRSLGYVEGQNIIIEYRFAQGDERRLVELAAELVRRKVDAMVVTGTQGSLAAMHVTRTIPIVMTTGSDAVARGIIASLAHPGGNVTGLTGSGRELAGKRLELLKEAVPRVNRVGVLWNPSDPGAAANFKATETAARALAVDVYSLEVINAKDFEVAFKAATEVRVQALSVVSSGNINAYRTQIVNFANEHRLPTMFAQAALVRAGGLMYYGPNTRDRYRRAATYVDKILKGAKPADLPVELPTKFDLMINLKTARALGLKIPPELLMEADKVIE